METPKEQLMVFEKIENAKINEIFNLVDENIIVTPIEKEKIFKITGEGFSNLEAYHINNALFNFMNAETEESMLKIIEKSKLSDDKKNILKENLQIMKKRTSKDKIETLRAKSFLQDFGHPRVHSIGAFTEFRPISTNGKITDIVPSIIIKGIIHNPKDKENFLINFQMSLKEFEEMIKSFQEDALSFKEEITEFKEKFGADVIDE